MTLPDLLCYLYQTTRTAIEQEDHYRLEQIQHSVILIGEAAGRTEESAKAIVCLTENLHENIRDHFRGIGYRSRWFSDDEIRQMLVTEQFLN